MPRLSITLSDEQNDRVEELVENGEYSSKNAVVQDWLTRAEKVNQLESEVERLRRQHRQLLEQREEHTELVAVVDRQQSLQERRAQASIFARMKWAVTGMPSED